MNNYINKQIIKHALQYYIQRPGATPKEIAREQRLLSQATEDITRIKQKYHIRGCKSHKYLSGIASQCRGDCAACISRECGEAIIKDINIKT